MNFLERFLPACFKAFRKPDRSEILELETSIKSNDQMIEATKPLVEEARKRSEDDYYKLRARSAVVARRVAYEGNLLRDLNEGWGKPNG